jgi:hypothetical protein
MHKCTVYTACSFQTSINKLKISGRKPHKKVFPDQAYYFLQKKLLRSAGLVSPLKSQFINKHFFTTYTLKEMTIYFFIFMSCLYFDRKEWNVRHLQFLWICSHVRHNRGHAIFLSRQPPIILHSKLYSVCPG